MNHHHRDLRRSAMRTSLDRVQGETPTPPEVIATLVRKARAEGVIVFLKDELERMPWQVQAIIEGEHRRICNNERR
jgi:hypothetical protein